MRPISDRKPPNAAETPGARPKSAVLRNHEARSGPRSLAFRAATAQGTFSSRHMGNVGSKVVGRNRAMLGTIPLNGDRSGSLWAAPPFFRAGQVRAEVAERDPCSPTSGDTRTGPLSPAPRTEEGSKVIVANPVMIDAYQAGVPGNGKPFPDSSKIVKLQWKPKKSTEAPFDVNVPDGTFYGRLSSSKRTARGFRRAADGAMRCSTMTPSPTRSRPTRPPATADTHATRP